MAANEYYFVSHWRMPCTPQEAYDIIKDAESLPRWWPAAFLDAQKVTQAGGQEGVALTTKGWLPYKLHWTVRELSSDPPGSLVTEVKGDFDGRGIWTLMQDGDYTNITFDWRIRVEKPGVKQLSFLLKPLFESNHRWAMRKGEQSLRLELMRRRATSEPVRQAIEPPPGPVPVQVTVIPIVAGVGLLALWLLRPRKKKTPREQLVTLANTTAKSIKAQRKEAEKAAKRAQKQLRRRGMRARQQLEAALERAQHSGNGARGNAASFLDRTGVDERVAESVGIARERLEAALERAQLPERVAAVRGRVEHALDESHVPERIQAARKAARNATRKRSKRLFGRWHL